MDDDMFKLCGTHHARNVVWKINQNEKSLRNKLESRIWSRVSARRRLFNESEVVIYVLHYDVDEREIPIVFKEARIMFQMQKH